MDALNYQDLEAALAEEAAAKEQAKQTIRDQMVMALERRPKNINLSATAALFDSIYGSKLLPAFKQPEDNTDEVVAGLGADLAKLEADPGSRVSLLNKKQPDNMSAAALKQDWQQGRFDQSQASSFEKEIQTDLDKDIFDPAADKLKQFNDIDAAIGSGDYKSVTAMLPQIARGLGQTGVLTDRDVALVFPKTVATKLADVTSYLSGTAEVPPELRVYLQRLVGRGRANLAEQIKTKAQAKQDLYKKRTAAQKYGTFQPGGFGEQTQQTVEGLVGKLKGADVTEAPAAPAPNPARERLQQLKAAKAAQGK